MDPKKNIEEQIALANAIIADIDDADPDEDMDALDGVLANAEKLSQLVLALDEWRRKGGFDPYTK